MRDFTLLFSVVFVAMLAFTFLKPTHYTETPLQLVNATPAPSPPQKVHGKTSKLLTSVVKITTINSDLQIAAGSGFVVSSDGYIVTNAHVVHNGIKILVHFSNKVSTTATIVGEDVSGDIALIRVKVPYALTPVIFGNDDDLEVGDEVTVIGNPAGLGFSVSKGIVSNPAKFFDDLPDRLIQVTAQIYPGNSGGPMFDLDGKVVGMSTLIIEVPGGELAFGISSDDIQWAVKKLRAGEKIERPNLGLSLSDHFHKEKLFCDNCEQSTPDGLTVRESINPDILVGDVIKKINGEEINNMDQLINIYRTILVGDKVIFTVERDGKSVDISTVASIIKPPPQYTERSKKN